MEKPDLSDNEEGHSTKQLLKDLEPTIGKIKNDKKKKLKTHGDLPISEFSIRPTKKISLSSLTATLDKKEATVFRNALKIGKTLKPLESPISRPELERKKKQINYKALRKNLNEWQDVVISTKKAPFLKFPLHDPDISQPSLLDWIEDDVNLETNIKKSEPQKVSILPNDDQTIVEVVQNLEPKDRNLIEQLHLEEMLLKRRQLSNYYEFIAKFGKERNRIKKIKSKNYHRKLKKKETKDLKNIDINEMKTLEPELYKRELEAAEKMRAEERACLRHRGGSKWSRNKLLKGQKNTQIRNALFEQLQINKELTISNKIPSDTSEEEVEDEKDQPFDGINNNPVIKEKVSKLLTNQWFSNSDTNLANPLNEKQPKYLQPKPFTLNSKSANTLKNIDMNPKETIENIIGENSNKSIIESVETEPIELFALNEVNPTQLDDIAEAFKDDDAIEEFIEEKEQALNDDDNNTEDLPGWGTWATTNNINIKKPIRRNHILIDDNKPHVIFNEPENSELHRHLVTRLPYEYKNNDEYEKSTSTPIGADWNTPTAFTKNIVPRVQVNPGVPIPALNASLKLKPSQQRLRNLASSLPLKLREQILNKI